MLVALPPNQNGYRMLLAFIRWSLLSGLTRTGAVLAAAAAAPPMLTSADMMGADTGRESQLGASPRGTCIKYSNPPSEPRALRKSPEAILDCVVGDYLSPFRALLAAPSSGSARFRGVILDQSQSRA